MRLDLKDNKRKAFQKLYVSRIYHPDITNKIAFVNCLVFILQFWMGKYAHQIGNVINTYGSLIPNLVVEENWWQIVAHAFLHVSKCRLLFNVIVLLVLRALIEPILGKARLILGYLFCIISTSAIATFISLNLGQGDVPCIGVSGAIMGLFSILIIYYRWS